MEESRSGQRKKTRKRKGGCLIPVLLLFFALAAVFIFILVQIVGNILYKKPIEQLEEGKVWITLKDEQIPAEYAAAVPDTGLSFSVDFVKEYIDSNIYWDGKKLTITTEDKVIRMGTDDLNYYVNNEPMTLDLPVYTINDEVYIPHGILEELYHLSVRMLTEEQRVIIDFLDEPKTTMQTPKKGIKIYYEADKKSGVAARTQQNEELTIFEEDGEFTKVRTSRGVVGYIFTNKLIWQTVTTTPQVMPVEPKEVWKPTKGKINMLWHQVFSIQQSSNPENWNVIDGLDVLSPTWFKLADSEGNIENIADKSYVQWAHQQGYQIWALITNSFDAKITHDTLSSTEIREKIIKQILAYVALYDIDGINIDFENLGENDGQYYIQFLRELAPFLKEQGVVLSVDMYIPSPWTKHYNMAEVGNIADYVCIMVYDEHYSGSQTSGSVSSLDWAEEAIANTVKLVPKEKVIMGMPFYTRRWEETTVNGTVELKSKAMGMETSRKDLEDNQAEIVYLQQTGQNYGEYTIGNTTYKIWLEDETSMEARLKLTLKYDIAGTSAWKKGFEKEEIWSLIKRYLKQE